MKQVDQEIISKSIFNTLPCKLVTDYLANGKFKQSEYHKNQVLHFEGDECTQIEFILDGEVVIERIGIMGDLMIINNFTTNDIIGSNLIFSSHNHYPMTITARKKTKVIVITKEVLFELCNLYPSFLLQFVAIISDLSLMLGQKFKHRMAKTIRQALIVYLAKQYEIQKSNPLKMTVTKKELAGYLGVSRTSLSREMAKMKAANLIDYDAKTITIIDTTILDQ